MELAVLNTQGKETGRKVVLSDAVFGVEANDHAIYLDVKQYLADQCRDTRRARQAVQLEVLYPAGGRCCQCGVLPPILQVALPAGGLLRGHEPCISFPDAGGHR